MTTSLTEKDLIRDEGWKTKPYKDSRGYLTVGVGHNLDASGLCEEAILTQLRYDIAKAERVLDSGLPGWRTKPEPVQRALVNLAFNLGDRLIGWPVTLTAIQENRFKDAAAAVRANKIYASQVGKRAERIARLLESVV